MLHERISPTQRTLRLLPDPIANTIPAKHMPARRGRRILEFLQTQRAFPLLRALDEPHYLFISQIKPRLSASRRVRRHSQVNPARLGPTVAELGQQQVAIRRVRKVMVKRDVDAAGAVEARSLTRRAPRPLISVSRTCMYPCTASWMTSSTPSTS